MADERLSRCHFPFPRPVVNTSRFLEQGSPLCLIRIKTALITYRYNELVDETQPSVWTVHGTASTGPAKFASIRLSLGTRPLKSMNCEPAIPGTPPSISPILYQDMRTKIRNFGPSSGSDQLKKEFRVRQKVHNPRVVNPAFFITQRL